MLQHTGSVPVAPGLSSKGLVVVRCRGFIAPWHVGSSRPGIEPMSTTLAGRFLSIASPGRSSTHSYSTFQLPLLLACFLQVCATLRNPMDSSLPGSSVHGIFPGKNTGYSSPFPTPGNLPDLGMESNTAKCIQYALYLSGFCSCLGIIYEKKEEDDAIITKPEISYSLLCLLNF